MSPVTRNQACSLLAILLAIAGTWGWLLPRLGRTDAISQRIERSRQLGINPAAIYYTDVFLTPTGQTARGEFP